MRMPFLPGLLIAAAATATVTAGCASAAAGAGGTAATLPASSPSVSPASPASVSPASPASASPGSPPGPRPPRCAFASGSPVPAVGDHVLTLGTADDGKTYCVTAGTSVLVLLKGTPGNKWGPIRASGRVLRPAASGIMSLMAGVTGASFRAVRPGASVISSTRPLCTSSTAPAGVPCGAAGTFRVTVIVRAS